MGQESEKKEPPEDAFVTLLRAYMEVVDSDDSGAHRVALAILFLAAEVRDARDVLMGIEASLDAYLPDIAHAAGRE